MGKANVVLNAVISSDDPENNCVYYYPKCPKCGALGRQTGTYVMPGFTSHDTGICLECRNMFDVILGRDS